MTWAPPSVVTTYEVVPLNGLWCVTPLGSTLAPCYSKEAAISAADAVARRHAPSRVVIHGDDGGIEGVRTFLDDAGATVAVSARRAS